MIGIIGALEEEVVLLKHDMTDAKVETVAKCEYVSGRLNGRDVVITRCGMGKVNSASCASVMIEKYHPDFIINTGVGGALDDSLNVCDIMIADNIVQHDYDIVSLGYELAQVDNFDTPYFYGDKRINEAIKKSCDKYDYPCRYARFATGDRFIDKQKDKDWITSNFGAQVCDMESGAIAQVCQLNNVRFTSIRTISDSGNSAEQFNKFLKLASSHSVIIIEDIIEHAEEIL